MGSSFFDSRRLDAEWVQDISRWHQIPGKTKYHLSDRAAVPKATSDPAFPTGQVPGLSQCSERMRFLQFHEVQVGVWNIGQHCSMGVS